LIDFINQTALYFVITFIALQAVMLGYALVSEIRIGGRKTINFENYKQKSKLFRLKIDLIYLIVSAIFFVFSFVFFIFIAISELTRILLVAYIPIYIAFGVSVFLAISRKNLSVKLEAFDIYYQKIKNSPPTSSNKEYEKVKTLIDNGLKELQKLADDKNQYIKHKITTNDIEIMFSGLNADLATLKGFYDNFINVEVKQFNEMLKNYLGNNAEAKVKIDEPPLTEESVLQQIADINTAFLKTANLKIEENVKKDGLIKCPPEFSNLTDKREISKFLSVIISHNAKESLFTLLSTLTPEHLNPINTALNQSAKNETANTLSLFKSLVLTEFLLGDISAKYENMLVTAQAWLT